VRLTYTRVLGLLLAVLLLAGVALLLGRTRIGLKMRALATDRDLSALLGIRVLQVDTVAWLLSGAFAGVCGLLLANIVRCRRRCSPSWSFQIAAPHRRLARCPPGGRWPSALRRWPCCARPFAPPRCSDALAATVLWRDTPAKHDARTCSSRAAAARRALLRMARIKGAGRCCRG
jgi:hypothetical protein